MKLRKIDTASWHPPGAVYFQIWGNYTEQSGERFVGEVILRGGEQAIRVLLWSPIKSEPYVKTFPLTELNETSAIRLYQETVKEMQEKTGLETWR